MKLFGIKDTHNNQLVPSLFFSLKQQAKKHRDELNEEIGEQRYVVTPGPDHWKSQPR